MNHPHSDGSNDGVNSGSHPACLPTEQLLLQCSVRRGRASGPGGQHRNKVETAVEITHTPTGIAGIGYERRSQEANRKVAIRRLRQNLAVNFRSVASEIVEPSPLWESRLSGGRIQCSDQHADFPAMLAEAINAVDAKNYDVKRAAAALGCSTSQLIRFLAKLPEALETVNQARESVGLKRLKR